MAAAGAKKLYVTEAGVPVHGVIAEFANPAATYHAAEKVRDAGYSKWDVFSPFLLVGVGAMTGVTLAYLMQWWMSAVDYPLVTQGKPYGSLVGEGGWESFVPITFELGVLFSAFTALIGMLALNGLPRHHHPLMKKERFLRVSDDRFIICVEAADDKFDPEATRALLASLGGTNIDLVEDE
jgi:hypothetical protein